MIDEAPEVREIHEIRLKMHEERKGLTDQEIIAKEEKEVAAIIKKYGLTNLRRPGRAKAR